jgi:hypothetical protein
MSILKLYEYYKEEIKQVLQISREMTNDKYLALPIHVGRSKGYVFAYLKDHMPRIMMK